MFRIRREPRGQDLMIMATADWSPAGWPIHVAWDLLAKSMQPGSRFLMP